jgi:hypothetical protein
LETGIIMTLIICGTIIAVVLIGIFFTVWVITKGIQVAKDNK